MASSDQKLLPEDDSVSDTGGSTHLWQTLMLQQQTGMYTSSSPRSGCVSEDQSSIKSDELSNIRVKLMCSYGGKILPRPYDNQLRYIGGETRILALDRNISLPELMQKMRKLAGKDILLKYQLPGEDLDALISVRTDEDLENMMDEYDRLVQQDSSSRLRVFLFPEKQTSSTSSSAAAAGSEDVNGGSSSEGVPRSSEQQFVDAVNGIAIPQVARRSATFAGMISEQQQQQQSRRTGTTDIKLPESLDVGDEEAGILFDFQFQQHQQQQQQQQRRMLKSPRSVSPHNLPPARIPLEAAPAAAFHHDGGNVLRHHYFAMQQQQQQQSPVSDHHHRLHHQQQQQPRSSSRSPTRSSVLDQDSPRTRAVMSPSRFRDAQAGVMSNNTPPSAQFYQLVRENPSLAASYEQQQRQMHLQFHHPWPETFSSSTTPSDEAAAAERNPSANPLDGYSAGRQR